MDKRKAQSAKRKVKNQGLKFLVLSFGFAFCTLHFTLDCFAQDKIVAIVNNDVITQKDLDDFINFMRVQLSTEYKGRELESKIQSMKLDLLDRLIEDRLILQEAKKELEEARKKKDAILVSRLQIDKSRIQARIEEIKKKYGSDAEFQRALSQQGLVQADIEAKTEEQFLMYNIIDAKIRSKIVVNPSDVTDFYNKNIEEFKSPEQREFEYIILEDENLAKEILRNLKDSQDLQEQAKKYSLTANRLNVAKNGQLRKDIEDAVFKLNLGEISQPIKIEESFYIFKLNNIILLRQQTLSEAKDKIYTFLFNMKMQTELTKWLDELKKQTYIKISQD